MSSQNSDFTRKLRAAVRAKIEEYGIDVDEELPDYVMIMVGNKKDKNRMKADLKLFLGDNTSNFVEWLFSFFQKVKAATSSGTKTEVFEKNENKNMELAIEKHKHAKDNAIQSKNRKLTEVIDKNKSKHTTYREVPSRETENKSSYQKQRDTSRDSLNEECQQSRRKKNNVISSASFMHDKKQSGNQPTNSTTFALPRQILRSVVVQPSNVHPRIYAKTPPVISRTPSPIIQKNPVEHLTQNQLIYQEPWVETVVGKTIEPKSKRRVLTTNSFLLFRRAINQSTTANDVIEEKPVVIEHTKAIQEHANLDVANITKRMMASTTTTDEYTSQIEQPITQKILTKALPISVPGTIFQKAIFDTTRQSHIQDVIATHSVTDRQSVKRPLSLDDEHKFTSCDNTEESESKRNRIEINDVDKSEEQQGEIESTLVVNFDKPATRSIRKEPRKPKSSLALLKQHIGVITNNTVIKLEEEDNQKCSLTMNDSNQNAEILTSIIRRVTGANADESNNAAASLWDGRIEIEDDTSSIDDEAEIDALLKEQNKLKQMALERERELKERELPPTTALTRPLFYQSVSANDALVSPTDIDLLPAVFSQKSEQQQTPIVAQQNPVSHSHLIKRPCAVVATVAPTTTVQTHVNAPVSIILPQTFYHHQQQQNTNTTTNLHPYITAATTAYQQPPHQKKNIIKSWGSFSKTYIAASMPGTGSFQGNITAKKIALPGTNLLQLREQHRLKTSQYKRQLEEQKLLLAQMQKMTFSNNKEQKKLLISRIKLMDKSTQQFKAEIEQLSEQISLMTGAKGGMMRNVGGEGGSI